MCESLQATERPGGKGPATDLANISAGAGCIQPTTNSVTFRPQPGNTHKTSEVNNDSSRQSLGPGSMTIESSATCTVGGISAGTGAVNSVNSHKVGTSGPKAGSGIESTSRNVSSWKGFSVPDEAPFSMSASVKNSAAHNVCSENIAPLGAYSISSNATHSGVHNVNQSIPQSGVHSVNQSIPQSGVHNVNQSIPQSGVHSVNQNMPQSGFHSVNQNMPQSGFHSVNQNMPQSGFHSVNQNMPQSGVHSVNQNMPQSGVHSVNQNMPQSSFHSVNQNIPQSGIHSVRAMGRTPVVKMGSGAATPGLSGKVNTPKVKLSLTEGNMGKPAASEQTPMTELGGKRLADDTGNVSSHSGSGWEHLNLYHSNRESMVYQGEEEDGSAGEGVSHLRLLNSPALCTDKCHLFTLPEYMLNSETVTILL